MRRTSSRTRSLRPTTRWPAPCWKPRYRALKWVSFSMSKMAGDLEMPAMSKTSASSAYRRPPHGHHPRGPGQRVPVLRPQVQPPLPVLRLGGAHLCPLFPRHAEDGRGLGDARNVEDLRQLGEGEDLTLRLLAPGAPAEKSHVVEDGLGKVALGLREKTGSEEDSGSFDRAADPCRALSPQEAQARVDAGEPYVIRLGAALLYQQAGVFAVGVPALRLDVGGHRAAHVGALVMGQGT